MPLRRITLLIALWTAYGADGQAIHSGPVYTSFTVFPEIRVLVTLPPAVKADAVSLKVDGSITASGTAMQTLADTGLGMAALVVMDAGPSVAGGPLNAVRAGLVKFTSEATLADRVALVTLSDDVKWEANWGDAADQVKAGLTGVKTRAKAVHLWEGILDALAKYPETPLARRLVLISEGRDDGSTHTLDDVISAAKQQHVVIDSIALPRADAKGIESLARLSNATGGLARTTASLTALEQLIGAGFIRYRALPVVTFRPEGMTADGRVHSFEVSWNGQSAAVEAALPEDPKPIVPEPAAKVEPLKPVEVAPVTEPIQPASSSKLWLYVVAGLLAVIALGVGVFFTSRQKKTKLPPTPFPDTTVAQSQLVPTPHEAPVAQPSQKGSVFMPLPAEILEQAPVTPTRPATWFSAPAKLSPAAWLACVEGPAAGQAFAIDAPQFWIGTHANNQLVLPGDMTVSGNHACIVFENDNLWLFDHRSTNGLFVNGQRLAEERHLVQTGDRIAIGRSTFEVRRQNDAA